MGETRSNKEEPPLLRGEDHPLMTPATLLIDFHSPAIQERARASSLYDGHELRALASHLRQALTPVWRPSPRITPSRGGSTLYDSFELKAVAKQLNRALHATKNGTSLYSNLHSLEHAHKKVKKPKQLEGPSPAGYGAKRGGVLPNMWKKLKRAILKTAKTI